jgi:hypothetical protein
MEARKLSDTQIEITKTVVSPQTQKVVYNISELQFQRARIVADAQAYAATRQKEIDEIDGFLGLAQAQGMRITVALPVEESCRG